GLPGDHSPAPGGEPGTHVPRRRRQVSRNTHRSERPMTQADDALERAEQERMILEAVDKFLAREVAPYAQKLEHDDTYPEEIVARMKELGLFGCIIPAEYGGLGLAPSTY